MIIAHLADLHLGFRAYSRVTADGVNQREADVAAAFAEAAEAIAGLRPDLVLVAGDVFHSVRPSNGAIAAAFRTFSSLASRLQSAPIIIVAGERDTPRSADTTSILELFGEIPGVRVATGSAERLHLREMDAEVLALPHAALAAGRPPRLKPSSAAGTRILVAHARLVGARADRLLGGAAADGGAVLDERALDAGEWAYVALGHHSLSLEIEENVWYAGSLERTSANPWAEAAAEKGFISYDTVARAATFHPVAARKVVDLPRVSARGRSAAEVDAAIAAILEEVPGGVAGKIARLVITDISRAEMRQLDHEALRRPRAEALHFLLDPRAPARESFPAATPAARGVSLERQVEEYLTRVWEPSLEGIDPARLATLARGYMEQAGEESES